MYTILQIIISVVVIYLIFSIVVFVIVEWFAGLIQLRGKMLENAIKGMFNDDGIADEILQHPVVRNLAAQRRRRPAYLPASSIAAAIIDLVSRNGGSEKSQAIERFKAGVANMPAGNVKQLLGSLGQNADDVKALGVTIEKWYNDGMDRLSGWYKVRTRTITLVCSIAITLIFNIDTIYIIRAAKADPVLRQRMNDLGDRILADSTLMATINSFPAYDNDYYEDYVNDSTITGDQVDDETAGMQGPVALSPDQRLQQLSELGQLIRSSDLPIGWQIQNDKPVHYIVLGWILTALALTAGAPFWFDLLKRLVNVRIAGPVASLSYAKEKSA